MGKQDMSVLTGYFQGFGLGVALGPGEPHLLLSIPELILHPHSRPPDPRPPRPALSNEQVITTERSYFFNLYTTTFWRLVREGLRGKVLRAKLYPLKEGIINDIVSGMVQALGARACSSGFMAEPERCWSKNQRLCDKMHFRQPVLSGAVVHSFCRYFPNCIHADCATLHETVFTYFRVRRPASRYYREVGSPDYRDLVSSGSLAEAQASWITCYLNIKGQLTRGERPNPDNLVLLLAWERELDQQKAATNALKKAQKKAKKAVSAQTKGGGGGAGGARAE